jgi:SRSO17 transposase
VRVHVGHRHLVPELLLEEWLLIEWPEGEAEPTKYWLSTLPENISFRRLVDRAKLRWRIERDYQELKQEVGLGHFEGRGWRGFPSSRHAVHRGLRIPGLREGDDSIIPDTSGATPDQSSGSASATATSSLQ